MAAALPFLFFALEGIFIIEVFKYDDSLNRVRRAAAARKLLRYTATGGRTAAGARLLANLTIFYGGGTMEPRNCRK